MRDENGQFIKGSSGNPKGRPKRASEQTLIDLWNSAGLNKFTEAIEKGEQWSIKLLIDKIYPNKKAVDMDISHDENGVVILPQKQISDIVFTWKD